jgi:hypothetical protein
VVHNGLGRKVQIKSKNKPSSTKSPVEEWTILPRVGTFTEVLVMRTVVQRSTLARKHAIFRDRLAGWPGFGWPDITRDQARSCLTRDHGLETPRCNDTDTLDW